MVKSDRIVFSRWC